MLDTHSLLKTRRAKMLLNYGGFRRGQAYHLHLEDIRPNPLIATAMGDLPASFLRVPLPPPLPPPYELDTAYEIFKEYYAGAATGFWLVYPLAKDLFRAYKSSLVSTPLDPTILILFKYYIMRNF